MSSMFQSVNVSEFYNTFLSFLLIVVHRVFAWVTFVFLTHAYVSIYVYIFDLVIYYYPKKDCNKIGESLDLKTDCILRFKPNKSHIIKRSFCLKLTYSPSPKKYVKAITEPVDILQYNLIDSAVTKILIFIQTDGQTLYYFVL